MMRYAMGVTAAAVAVVFAVMAIWPEGSGELTNTTAQAQQVEKSQPVKKAPPAKTDKPDPNSETLAKLETTITVEFPKETPLTELLAYLADRVAVQFYVDERVLSDVGITNDTPIKIHLTEVPAEMVLRLVLRRLELSYTLDHGVVMVTTFAEAQANLDTRVYRIGDLVRMPAASERPIPVPPEGETSSAEDSMFSSGAPPAAVPFGYLDAIIDLIKSTIEPTSWDVVGGAGSIAPYRGTLVITQTMRLHQKVENLLNDLREAIDPDFPVRPTSK